MKDLSEIIEVLRKHGEELKKNFKIEEIKIFGSYVKGSQKESSDIDIIVKFEEPPTFIEFMRIQEELERLLGTKVDLLTEESISPFIKPYIKDVVTV